MSEVLTVGKIPSLNGLRAISILLVFFSHAGRGDVIPGGFGVTIFFFLSGFLITTLMRVEYAKNGHVNLRHFWIRRALRILPPFYIVLVGACIATTTLPATGPLSGATVLARALHVTNYWSIYRGIAGEPVGTSVYWSLAVEEHFYLLFPWIYLMMQRFKLASRDQALTLWGLCIAVLLWRWALVEILHAPVDRTYLASDTRMDSILFGCALAVWHNPVLDRYVLREGWWKYRLLPGTLLVLLACLLIRSPAFRETVRYSLQGIALTGVFVAAIRFPDWGPFRILNWNLVEFLGVLSYSFYLLHFTVIFCVQNEFPSVDALTQAFIAFAISLMLAWMMYVLVERPCAQLRKRLTD